MADTALFIGYGPTIPGREQRALALFNEVLGYYNRLQERGEIESFEAVLLEPHGGELGGFLLLRGAAAERARARGSAGVPAPGVPWRGRRRAPEALKTYCIPPGPLLAAPERPSQSRRGLSLPY